MDIETLSRKQLNELEHCVMKLLAAMRKAKLQNDPIVESLKELEYKLGQARRARFDAVNSEFHTY